MKLYSIETQKFKLDGGAMFGVVPKTIWNKTNPADANNLIDMAARCLLIEDGDKLILIDTGMGEKQSEKFFGYYALWGDDTLVKSLAKHGFHPDDLTDVFLTHL
ncbi:MAG: MBL fold metallo-hydrolase, partial [Flavobacteriaceae bacterium]|nr:MBL fold metallo-hydrolase [Flavobacteriaceae bacterium]